MRTIKNIIFVRQKKNEQGAIDFAQRKRKRYVCICLLKEEVCKKLRYKNLQVRYFKPKLKCHLPNPGQGTSYQ